MGRIMLLGLLLTLGCARKAGMKESIDYVAFEYTGGTFFSEPERVSTKELHLDGGQLTGKEVIIEGDIISLGKYATHLMVGDDSGKLLVVLTALEDADVKMKNRENRPIKILGSIERGRKGLPYLLARSVNFDLEMAAKKKKTSEQ